MLAVWLCVWTAAASAQAVITINGKLGGKVVLKPTTTQQPITSITWREGPDIAIEWDGNEMDKYRQFKERGDLNVTNAEMTITGLTGSDSGEYTVEINSGLGATVHLMVFSAVPKPSVTQSCDEKMTRCDLSCDGDTAKGELLNYTWRADDTEVPEASLKTYAIFKEHSSKVGEFSCQMRNLVSVESSPSIPNPFLAAEGLKVSTGLIVFVILLVGVLLLVAIHRLKTGMWFFEKGSMPWKADFWRRNEGGPTDAVESNGAPAAGQPPRTEEETQML